MLGELGGSIDLDEVLTRTLEAAGALPGVDAALITVEGGRGGDPVVAALGLSAEEAEAPVDQRAAGRSQAAGDRALLHLRGRGELGGRRAAPPRPRGAAPARRRADRLPRRLLPLGGRAVRRRRRARARGARLRAGPAIENARRFREARQLADLDALTGLHNRRYFHETLAREVARAHRYDRAASR